MSDEHRSGMIIQAAVNLLRAEPVAGEEVWRSRPQVAHDDDNVIDELVVIHQGPEEIVQYLTVNLVDVRLTMICDCNARGKPSAMPGLGDTAAIRVGTLRRNVTRVILGDNDSSTINLGLSYVIDIDEIGASALEIEEDGAVSLGAQQQIFEVLYRRSRLDPWG